MAKGQQDEHEFMVAGVGEMIHGIAITAITLVDARGGRVRLHLSTDMAELLRESVVVRLKSASHRKPKQPDERSGLLIPAVLREARDNIADSG